MPSRFCSWTVALVLVAAAWGATADGASAQGGLDAFCATAMAPSECRLAAGTTAIIHSRVGTALWGGNPVPGTASTLGMRIGSVPRFSVSGRVAVTPVEIPPLLDRSGTGGSSSALVSLSGLGTVGLLSGWSPLPTVGGLLSVDLVGRVAVSSLPEGFTHGSVWGWSTGLRVGLLRESFTLPGISVTGSYGRSGKVTFGEAGGGTDGYVRGAIGDWNAAAAATKRIGPVGVTAGAAYDRYTGNVSLGYSASPGSGQLTGNADAATARWSLFGNVAWTFLIASGSLEGGWQESPVPTGLPASVTLDPSGWWIGAALRLSL